jgi:hypothetical protein
MNGESIIRLLHELLNTRLTERQREIVNAAIQHIIIQGDEMQKHKDDITDLKIPRDPNADHLRNP